MFYVMCVCVVLIVYAFALNMLVGLILQIPADGQPAHPVCGCIYAQL